MTDSERSSPPSENEKLRLARFIQQRLQSSPLKKEELRIVRSYVQSQTPSPTIRHKIDLLLRCIREHAYPQSIPPAPIIEPGAFSPEENEDHDELALFIAGISRYRRELTKVIEIDFQEMHTPVDELLTSLAGTLHTLSSEAEYLEIEAIAKPSRQLENTLNELINSASSSSQAVATLKSIQPEIYCLLATLHRLFPPALISRTPPLHLDHLKFWIENFTTDTADKQAKEVKLELLFSPTLPSLPSETLTLLQHFLIHLIRNAIHHGIESPEERKRSGKPFPPVITVELQYSAPNLLLCVSDDGKGLSREFCKKAGIADPAHCPSEQLTRLLTAPGVSQDTSPSEFSGYGMGLFDIARQLKHVGGNLRISAPGSGLRVVLSFPLSLPQA
ncbi:MAG: hypothetical protein D6820_11335 [Lentisphaerae bacterium]|nr:MAG: hypothetical protein D6820_11335 [Lentisphaerota bacterium]